MTLAEMLAKAIKQNSQTCRKHPRAPFDLRELLRLQPPGLRHFFQPNEVIKLDWRAFCVLGYDVSFKGLDRFALLDVSRHSSLPSPAGKASFTDSDSNGPSSNEEAADPRVSLGRSLEVACLACRSASTAWIRGRFAFRGLRMRASWMFF